MKGLKRFVGAGEGGFTLVEMTVVVAIIAVLAALALPAVSGVTTSTRGTSKIGDQKAVQQASVRYADQNGGDLPSSVSPTLSVRDTAPFDGIIKIGVDTGTLTGGASPTFDVLCTGLSDAAALASCFGGITFSTLVPTYMSVSPKHATDSVSATDTNSPDSNLTGDNSMATADFTIPNCNLAGDTCEFYLQLNDTADSLQVWSVDTDNTVFAFKEDNIYGQ